jgi:hypothetical protein
MIANLKGGSVAIKPQKICLSPTCSIFRLSNQKPTWELLKSQRQLNEVLNRGGVKPAYKGVTIAHNETMVSKIQESGICNKSAVSLESVSQ